MLKVTHQGSFKRMYRFLEWGMKKDMQKDLHDIGKIGVRALSEATPIDTGETASSWDYEIENRGGKYRINWTNSHIDDDVLVAVLIQYGHATGTGGYVPALDYINPVMYPLFGKVTQDFWEEVKNA